MYVFSKIIFTEKNSFFRQEIKANEEPFEKERALMSTLIVYCQKLLPAANENSSEDLNSTNSSEVNTKVDLKNIQQISKDESAPENCTAYRKNDDDDFLFAGVTKKSGNKSKGAKKLKVRISNICSKFLNGTFPCRNDNLHPLGEKIIFLTFLMEQIFHY